MTQSAAIRVDLCLLSPHVASTMTAMTLPPSLLQREAAQVYDTSNVVRIYMAFLIHSNAMVARDGMPFYSKRNHETSTRHASINATEHGEWKRPRSQRDFASITLT